MLNTEAITVPRQWGCAKHSPWPLKVSVFLSTFPVFTLSVGHASGLQVRIAPNNAGYWAGAGGMVIESDLDASVPLQ